MPLDKGIYFCIKYYLYIIYLLYGWGKFVSSIQVQQGRKSRRSRSKQGRRCSPRCGGRDIPSSQPAAAGPLRQMPREGERCAAPCLQDESAGRRLDRPARDDARRHPDGHAHTAEGAGGPLGPWRGSRPRYDDGGAAAFDRADGKLLTQAQDWNAQAPYGADVISRIQHTMEASDGLGELSRCIRAQTETLLDRHFPPPDGRRMKSRSSSLRAIP